jgi:HAMP domain-containing protein
MIVICEECGKKYQIDPSRISEAGAKAKCKACGSVMHLSRPEARPVEKRPPAKPSEPLLTPRSEEEVVSSGRTGKETPPTEPAAVPKRRQGMGLRSKIFLLFFVLPILLIIGAGVLYLQQLNELSSLITGESKKVVTQLGEQIIAEKARSVAEQARLYLLSHPNLRKEEYNANPECSQIAVQKVGLTGYTALYAVPDKDGVWRTWAHANSKIVAIDMSTLKGPMGRNFPGFWKVFSSAKDGKESSGYYTWQEKDGSFRDKYMVCSPVKGTPYVVAATTYLDEFTKPVNEMEARANAISTNTRRTVFGILGGTLLLIGFIVAFYGQRLTSKIKALTQVAERISVGEMDEEITVRSKDELGDLAESISRMQESIRLSIERLRRRR